jgi:mannose-6-phosphate isomerase-like protein (cupin superfamily)
MDEPAGPVVAAPRSGKRVRYLETAADTDGEYARFEMWLAPPPASHGPMRHVHPKQDEYLAVREGRLGVWHAGDERELGAGESVTIPAGDPHRFWNAGDGELRLVGEVRPALDTEAFIFLQAGNPAPWGGEECDTWPSVQLLHSVGVERAVAFEKKAFPRVPAPLFELA